MLDEGRSLEDPTLTPATPLRSQWFSNTPYAVTSSTADMALLLTLQVLRGSTEAEANARAGKWRAGLDLTKDPQGLRLGIVGMGAIGSTLAARAAALGMEVVYNNRTKLSREDEIAKAGGAKWVPFDELLATSDVVVSRAPLADPGRARPVADRSRPAVAQLPTQREHAAHHRREGLRQDEGWVAPPRACWSRCRR